MLGILQNFRPESDQIRTTSAPTLQETIRDPEYQKLEERFARKDPRDKTKFTKRGMRDLLALHLKLVDTKAEAIKRTKALLEGLKGEDGLARVLGTLKLATEGLSSILKGMKKQTSS